ncbi:MAG: DNA helicase RecQ [Bdellovibrionota bacterium]
MTERAEELLKSVFGFDSFRGPQQAIIERLILGGDSLVLMPTGSGKSLCYQLPSLVRSGVGIVVSPLIALMQDQVQSLKELGVRAECLNSALSSQEARSVIGRLLAGSLDLLYVAPERANRPEFLELLRGVNVALFAIDEAHCVSMWGHDFRPDYTELGKLATLFPGVPRIALTATADVPTREDIRERLSLLDAAEFITSFDRPNIQYNVSLKSDPRAQLKRFLAQNHPGEAGIVYCLSRRKVEETAEWMSSQGYNAIPYHAGLSDEVRAANQRRFIYEEGVIMVATIAFGMGIDKPNVRFVVHLDMPKNIEAYYQETGRAGRDGLPATALMLYGLQDIVLLRQMIDGGNAPDERKRVEQQKLSALLGYAETVHCRRNVLLEYFGENKSVACGNCDTCLQPVEAWDGTIVAQQALSCVYRTGQRFGVSYLTDVLRGALSDRIVDFQHDRLTVFGIGKDLSKTQWAGVFRQLIAGGYLQVDIGGFGGLHLAAKSAGVLRNEERVFFRHDPAAVKESKKARGSRASSADPSLAPREQSLFEKLRACRLDLAKKNSVPPYVIFHDTTLKEIAKRNPQSVAELQRISGIGEAKLARYGEALLTVLRAEG